MRSVRIVQALLVVVLMLVAGASTAQADPPPCADLQITGIATTPTEPVQGLDATVDVTVKNAGDCAAGGFVVQWKSDRFAQTGPSQSVSGLDAGQSTVVSFTYAFPNSGNFTTFASVDTANAVPETNENNNLAIQAVTVQPQKIDLKVTKIALDPTPAVAGKVATVHVTIANEGNAPAGPFRLDWSPALFAPSLSRQLPGLGTNETTTVDFTYTYANAGTFNSNASVDATGMVGETNELNNTTWQDVVVDPDLPNLRVADFSLDQPKCDECECQECGLTRASLTTQVFSDGPVIQGTPAHFTARIINDGHEPSGSFRVTWTPHFLASPLTEQVDSLGVGDYVDVHFTYTFPWPGKMDGTIVVDPGNAVNEVHEDDNTANTSIDVQAATRDLEVTDLSVSPGSPVQGAQATFYATVTNHGNSPTGPFVLEINPDTFEVITPSMKTVSQQINDLGPGQSTVVALPVTYPQKGNFRVVANADAFNTVPETNEANNLKILNVTVQPAPIDLVITSFSLSPSTPVRGDKTTASITVKNNGPIDTGGFFVSWKPTSDAWWPSLAYVPGLHPGQSQTVTMDGTYWGTGSFTTVAEVDPFNMVEEPGPGAESNNTQSMPVTVVPPSTTLDVKLDHLIALDDMDSGLRGSEGEWDDILYAVFDPKASCSIDISRGPLGLFHIKTTVPMVACTTASDDHVQDDDAEKKVVPINKTLRVTLEDFTPLVAAVGVLENDDPAPPDVPGVSTLIKFKPDYLNLPGTTKTPGQYCSHVSALGEFSEADGGHCFDAYWQVSTVGTVGSQSLAAQMTEAALPGGTSRISNSTIRLAATHQAYLARSLSKLQRKVAKFSRKASKSHKKHVRKGKLRVRLHTVRR